MDTFTIKSILYNEGKPLQFNFNDGSGKKVPGYSRSDIVQSALMIAFLGNSKVEVDFVDQSEEIKRVYPFEASSLTSRNLNGDFSVSRIATQRVELIGDHLEIFIKARDEENETAYNITDPFLQKLLLTSFLFGTQDKYNLYLIVNDKSIKTASIGEEIN